MTREGRNAYYKPAPVKRSGPAPKVPPPREIMKDPQALGFWKRHAPALIESGHLDPVMADAFAIGCKLFSDCQRLEALLAETGEIIATSRGTPCPHPAVRMLRDSRRDLAKICGEFGMTPAATARIPKARDTSKEPANPLEAFGITG